MKYTEIKTFEDACKAQNLDATKVIPDFSYFPEQDRQAMINHAKLVIIHNAIRGDWTPDWNDSSQYKYYPYFKMGSSFGFNDCHNWYAYSGVSSRFALKNKDQVKHVVKYFEELFKEYFIINKQPLELTIVEIAEKFGVSAEQIKIKK